MNQSIPLNISPNELDSWFKKDCLQPLILDVREVQELAIAPFSRKVINLPLSEASSWTETFEKRFSKKQPIVVICHAGIRSLQVASWLTSKGWGYEVWNLEGGLEAWTIEVDPSIPRY